MHFHKENKIIIFFGALSQLQWHAISAIGYRDCLLIWRLFWSSSSFLLGEKNEKKRKLFLKLLFSPEQWDVYHGNGWKRTKSVVWFWRRRPKHAGFHVRKCEFIFADSRVSLAFFPPFVFAFENMIFLSATNTYALILLCHIFFAFSSRVCQLLLFSQSIIMHNALTTNEMLPHTKWKHWKHTTETIKWCN